MDVSSNSLICEGSGATADRDEATRNFVETWGTPEQPGDAASCPDTRDSPLAGRLSGFIDELISAADHLSQLFDRLPIMSPADAEASYQHVIRTILKTLTTVDSKIDTFSRKSSIRIYVENYINRNLSCKYIGPEHLYKELEIPRSSLYKAFSDSGGVGKFIQDRRLDVARTLLAHPEEHRSLSHIADSLGFESSAHFSKAFRRRFGCAPRNVRTKAISRLR